MKTRRYFTKEYKQEAVNKSYQVDNVKQFARDLGITSAMLYRWRKEFKVIHDTSTTTNDLKDELRFMKRLNQWLLMNIQNNKQDMKR